MTAYRLHVKSISAASCVILVAVVIAPLAALLIDALHPSALVGSTAAGELIGTRQIVLLGKSIAVSLGSALIGTALGLCAGYAVSLQPSRRHVPYLASMLLPLLIPPFIHALSWIMLADRLGESVHGFWPSTLILGAAFFPLAGLLSWAGLIRSRGTGTDAALLAHSRFKALLRIELGSIRPHLLTAFILIALFSFSDYGVPSLLRFNTYPVVVFSQFAAYYDLRSAVLSAWPYIVLPAAVIILWRALIDHRLFEMLGRGFHPETDAVRGSSHPAWRIFIVLLIIVTGLIPIAMLLVAAGGVETYAAAWRTAHAQILTSLGLAAVAAVLMSIAGGCIGWAIAHDPRPLSACQDFVSLLPLALPGTVLGIGMILLWNHHSTSAVYGSSLIIVLLAAARFLPFAVRSQLAGLRQIGGNLIDAAVISGSSMPKLWRRIIVPIMLPSALAGWLLCFVLSFRELAGTLLVTPPGVETLSVRIYSLHHYGAGGLVAALSLFMLLCSLCAAAGAALLYRGLRRCCA